MKKLLLALALALAPSYAFAADNFAATAGSGLTFGAKDAAGILYTRFIGCDNTTVSQCWAVDASGRLTVNINGTVTVTGTVAATQSGTWTVQPGNTANTTAWKVDGSAVTQPVSAAALPLPSGAATSANQATEIASLATIATNSALPLPAQSTHTVNIGAVDAINPYPATAVPYTATATGTTGATTATLAGASSVTTYICGFSIRANATAAVTGNATVTGVITATLNFTQWTAPNATGLGVTEMIFSPCVPASGTNQSIAVVSAAPGTGGVVSVTAWGYKL